MVRAKKNDLIHSRDGLYYQIAVNSGLNPEALKHCGDAVLDALQGLSARARKRIIEEKPQDET